MMNLFHNYLLAITICKPGISSFSASYELDKTKPMATDFYNFIRFNTFCFHMLPATPAEGAITPYTNV